MYICRLSFCVRVYSRDNRYIKMERAPIEYPKILSESQWPVQFCSCACAWKLQPFGLKVSILLHGAQHTCRYLI